MWQIRAITQPSAIIAMEPKPNSSAPINAPIRTSQPLFRPPSTRKMTRSRKLFSINTRCTSVKPNSQGLPACLIEERGDAPVPPSCPEIWIISALALATPAAIVPIPISATNFTETWAVGLIWCKSKINWARSSME